jgi:superfamily II DNA helicase RecQ
MLIKIFSLTFNSATGGFDDRELRDYIKDKEIISMNDHFFVRNEIPYLSVVIKYYPYRREVEPVQTPAKARQREASHEGLTPEIEGVFNLLRDWRSTQARKEGVPPYIIFNNRQLIEIIKTKAQSFAELERVNGIGKVKVEKYGPEILEIIKPLATAVSIVEEVNSSEKPG